MFVICKETNVMVYVAREVHLRFRRPDLLTFTRGLEYGSDAKCDWLFKIVTNNQTYKVYVINLKQ